MPAHSVAAIHDTTDGVVHVPDWSIYARQEMENLDAFIAWLNTKAKAKPDAPRFVRVVATPLDRAARGGMSRRYTEYLKGEPEVRIRDAMHRLLNRWTRHADSITVVQRRGVWEMPNAASAIQAIADEASVSFNDARAALLTYLRSELGELMDRVTFPPENAVRAPQQDEDAEQTYPVNL